MSPLFKQFVIFIMLLFMTAAYAESNSIGLKKNPFKRPAFSSDKNNTSFTTKGSLGEELNLRAVMFAGENSLVNVDGNIIRIGEEIHGYRLLSVREGKIIFSKNNSLVTVFLKKDQLGN